MKLTETTKRLLAELEDEIGNETYNPNSYDGWHDEEGCSFRYPITIPYGEDNSMHKLRNWRDYNILLQSKDLSLEQLMEMRYKFGSNELYIGRGILNVLSYLEDRYGIDFEKLERGYQEKNLNQKYFTKDNCISISEDDDLTGKILVTKFSDYEKRFYSPKSQLVYCSKDYGTFLSIYRCSDDEYLIGLDDKMKDFCGIATNKTIEEWHRRYGDFDKRIKQL